MVTVPLQKAANHLNRLAQRDFCPWANRYVYWLKEPVGWFVLAMLASCLVGVFVSPVGWTLAAGLAALVFLGLVFPWLATRGVRCKVRPVNNLLHERQQGAIELHLMNYLPIPVVGMVIENYFEADIHESAETVLALTPRLGLQRVPPLCSVVFRLPVAAEYRGIYPTLAPLLACAFPFGIWTARRKINDFQPITVLPLIVPISEEVQLAGKKLAESGMGARPSDHGEFMGVRDFRRGDSLKSIHWAQSARLDQIVICERGGPQQHTIALHLSTDRCAGSKSEIRENLAWRVRIAASLIDLLAERHLACQLVVDGQRVPHDKSIGGQKQALRHLAQIPLNGGTQAGPASDLSASGGWISIGATGHDRMPLAAALVRIEAALPVGGIRDLQRTNCLLDLDSDLSDQLNQWLTELGHVFSGS